MPRSPAWVEHVLGVLAHLPVAVIQRRAKNLVELARTIADLSPQVEPQRAKVKAAESAYLAKLPKRNVAQAK